MIKYFDEDEEQDLFAAIPNSAYQDSIVKQVKTFPEVSPEEKRRIAINHVIKQKQAQNQSTSIPDSQLPPIGLDRPMGPEPLQALSADQASDVEQSFLDKYRSAQTDEDGKYSKMKENTDLLNNISMIAEGLSGYANAGASARGYKSNLPQFTNKLRASGDARLSRAATDRDKKLAEMRLGNQMERDEKAYGRSQEMQKRMDDPNSEESKTAQALALKLMPGKDWSQMSATTLEKTIPGLTKMYEIDQRSLDRQEARADRAYMRGLAGDQKRELQLDKDTNRYSNELEKSGIPAAVSNLEEVEKKIGTKGDIPGYGMVDGMMHDVLAGQDGRDVRQSVAALFNTVLKDRSGAAVTDPELERLKKEFGDGTMKTEADLRNGVAKYRARLEQIIKNRNAGTDETARQEYVRRGGRDFDSIGRSPQPSHVRVQGPDGKVRLVPKERVKDAIAAGGKVVE